MSLALAQNLVVALIVCACSLYALWSLMPAAARRFVATLALRFPLPTALASPLRRAAQPANSCGCEGCNRTAPKPAAGATQRVTFRPRPPR